MKVTKVALRNVGRMGRRKFHGGQFSGEYQPANKIKTKEEENEEKEAGPITALKAHRQTALNRKIFLKL